MSFDFSGMTEEQAMEMMYPKQLEAYKACRFGTKDVLITASGGFGKSFIIDALMYFSKYNTVATATSGVAATNINGATLHSTVSLPLGIPTKDQMKKVGRKYRSLFKKDHPIENVIIDEFPMLRVDSFDALLQRRQRISRTARSKHVRLLMFGDFYQLGSVVKDTNELEILMHHYDTSKLLASDLWKNFYDTIDVFELDQNKRVVGNDKIFVDRLEDLRQGRNIDEVLEYFNQRVVKTVPESTVFLTTTNEIADRINNQAFKDNPNKPFTYYANVKGDFKEKDSKVPLRIDLKVGLRVMSLYNSEDDLFVNGSMGTIISLSSDGVEVEFDSGVITYISYFTQEKREYYTDSQGELCSSVVASFEQIGAKICSAISIHKSQSLSLDEAVLDISRGCFADGQAYVGISRLRSLDGLYLLSPLKITDIKVDIEAKKFYSELRGEVYNPSEDMSRVPKEYQQYKIRLIVAGGRDFSDYNYLEKCLDFMLQRYNKDEILIVDGGALGADRLGRNYAMNKGIRYKTFNANWKDIDTPPVLIRRNAYGEYNALAGIVRNHQMGDFGSHLVAFHDGKSKGTQDMVTYMKSLEKPVKVFTY